MTVEHTPLDIDASHGWFILCYGRLVGVPCETATRARAEAETHIRNCPDGPMPWATEIEWHLTNRGVWVASCNEWLDHSVTACSCVQLGR